MKKIIFLLITLFFYSCSVRYYGYVYDFDTRTPISKVEIRVKNLLDTTLSKKDGYFEINIAKKTRELIFHKEGYQLHALKTLSIQSGEFMKEQPFGDTIFIISKDSKYNRPKIKLSNYK
ncbi:hypothetical protein CXF68_19000 [Tenacibaculum sp. Bg11-29]|uniref:hypothetical protein n=1 Tax=Tenacibaculum sp. Bg11-29 TaxID=2058306 RepID=UPI000C321C60|nr:hypothetical protein [Tenacibaculum sp. Bg11-29]PKH52662.1 hypothetical protein CXF68_19000 [Tenacibaculum sp. Bg11-29]